MNKISVIAALLASLPTLNVVAAVQPLDRPVALLIESQSLDGALNELAVQSGVQLLYPASASGIDTGTTARIDGTFTPPQALKALLANSGLQFDLVDERTIAIRVANASAPGNLVLARNAPEGEALPEHTQSTAGPDIESTKEDAVRSGIPEILIKSSRSLNVDIERTPDDIQPYTVLDRAMIERSGATNVEQLIRDRLTMNYTPNSNAAIVTQEGNTSTLALRGLSPAETLILIDGRSLGSRPFFNSGGQGDLNGIPLAAIERIEILPATASGIYGGGATGGVVNIIMKRRYSGLETALAYENTWDNDAATRRVDISGGFEVGRRTNVLLSGSYSDSDPLFLRDRPFAIQRRAGVFENDPTTAIVAASPPLGATTNVSSVPQLDFARFLATGEIVFTKSSLVLKDGTSLNSPITFIPRGYSGFSSDGGAALLQNAGSYNLEWANTAQSGGGGNVSLRNAPTTRSMSATIRHQFTESIEGFLDLWAADNLGYFETNRVASSFTIPASAPNNPFNQSVRVTTPAFGADATIESQSRSRRGVIGVIASLGREWRTSADFAWTRQDVSGNSPSTTLASQGTTAVTTGAIDVLRDTNQFPVDFSGYLFPISTISPTHTILNDARVQIAGPLGALPGGKPQVTVVLQHRVQKYSDYVQSVSLTLDGQQSVARYPAGSERVASIYVEAKLPLISQTNRRPALETFDFQLAGRLEDYKIDGADPLFSNNPQPERRGAGKFQSINPTVGLRYQPVRDLTVRTSFGTGFLPPNRGMMIPAVPTVLPAADVAARNLRDPMRGNELIGELIVGSETVELRPEKSKSWSAGAILAPRVLPGLRVSFDWVSVRKRDNITNIALEQQNIDNEAILPGIVVRAPVAPSDPLGVGPIVGFLSGLHNALNARVESFDYSVDYVRTSRFGELSFLARATEMTENVQQFTLGAPEVEQVGFVTYPKWRANATLAWQRGSLAGSWTTTYLDSYWINSTRTFDLRQESARVSSGIYHDVAFDYRFSAEGRYSELLSGLTISAGVRNVFNTRPRFTFTGAAFSDPWTDTRLSTYYLSVRKAF